MGRSLVRYKSDPALLAVHQVVAVLAPPLVALAQSAELAGLVTERLDQLGLPVVPLEPPVALLEPKLLAASLELAPEPK